MTPDLSALEAELQRDPSSRRFGELAREYQRLGRLDEARDLCERGLLKHPTQWQARLLLAQVYLAQGRLEEARGCVEKILLALPENVQANHLAADIYLSLGQRPKALKHYQVVELFEPGRAGVSRAIAGLTAEPSAPAVAPAPAPAPAAPVPPAVPAAVEEPVVPTVLPEEPPAANPEPDEPAPPAVRPEGESERADEAFGGPVAEPFAEPARAERIPESVEAPAAIPPAKPPDDFVGTIKIPTWTAEPDSGTSLEDVDQTAPQPVFSAEESSFVDLSASGAEDQLGGEFLDAHEQTLTELPQVPPPGIPAPAPAVANPLPPASSPLATEPSEGPALSTTTLAVLYAEQGYPEKAIEVYQRVLLQDPERADIKRKIQELMQRISGEAPEMPDVRQEDVRRALRQRRVQVLEGWLRRVREERHV